MCQTAQPPSASAPSAAAPLTASAALPAASRAASSAASTQLTNRQPPNTKSAPPNTDTFDEDDDDEEEGWDGGEDDEGDESFQKSDNSSFALSDEKATALHEQFSEVCQLLRPEESEDGKKRKSGKRKSAGSEQADERRVKELITAVYTTHVLPTAASSVAQAKRGRKKKVQCEVCYEETHIVTDLTTEHKADDDTSYALTLPGCQHNQVCTTCMSGHVQSKVTSADVAAWVSCPHPTCTTPLHPTVLCYPGLLTSDLQLLLLLGYLTKLLSRSTAFVRCSTSQCPYGFLCLAKTGKESRACPVCHKEQSVERGGEGELDESFKKMIALGTLRACPTCSHYTLKEKGICNVIECAKCGVWWNWRTRETGKSGSELKQRARAMGTLWEQGELQYQMELERRNPNEFKALLERNGMVGSSTHSAHITLSAHAARTDTAVVIHISFCCPWLCCAFCRLTIQITVVVDGNR